MHTQHNTQFSHLHPFHTMTRTYGTSSKRRQPEWKSQKIKHSDESMTCLVDKKGTALINSRGYSKLCKVKTSKFQAQQRRICKTLLRIQELGKIILFCYFLAFNNIVFLSLSSLKVFPYTTILSPLQLYSYFEGFVNQQQVFYVTCYMHACMSSPNQT